MVVFMSIGFVALIGAIVNSLVELCGFGTSTSQPPIVDPAPAPAPAPPASEQYQALEAGVHDSNVYQEVPQPQTQASPTTAAPNDSYFVLRTYFVPACFLGLVGFFFLAIVIIRFSVYDHVGRKTLHRRELVADLAKCTFTHFDGVSDSYKTICGTAIPGWERYMRERKLAMFGIFGQAVLLGIIYIPAYVYKFFFASTSSDVSAVSTTEDVPNNTITPAAEQHDETGIEMQAQTTPEVVTAVPVDPSAPPMAVVVSATNYEHDPVDLKKSQKEPDTIIHDLEDNTQTVAVTGVSSASI